MTTRRPWAPNTLLDGLSPLDCSALIALGTERVYAPGQTLIADGGRETDVFVLLSGCARVESSTIDGRTVLLSLRVAGEMVGELAALTRRPRSAAVVAATTVTARTLSRDALRGYLADHPRAAETTYAAIADKLQRATRHRVEIAGSSVPLRLALVLHHLAETYGRPSAGGIRIGVPLSQPDLATLISVSDPSLRRALSELRLRGLVKAGYRTQVVTDLPALHLFATGQ